MIEGMDEGLDCMEAGEDMEQMVEKLMVIMLVVEVDGESLQMVEKDMLVVQLVVLTAEVEVGDTEKVEIVAGMVDMEEEVGLMQMVVKVFV